MLSIIFRISIVIALAAIVWFWYSNSDTVVRETVGLEAPGNTDDSIDAVINPDDESATAVDALPQVEQLNNATALSDGDQLTSENLSAFLGYSDDISIDDVPTKVTNDVPFVVQAPTGQWDEAQFQDACEEASLLMVHGWLERESFTTQEATEELEKIFQFERDYFNREVIDTSIEDTARISDAYFDMKGHLVDRIMIEDLYYVLANEYVIIAPTDGRALRNPNFVGGGPERHMVVITGYDRNKDIFYVNDPGTRRGGDYEYDAALLYNAIRDYNTGNKEPILQQRKMIYIIKK